MRIALGSDHAGFKLKEELTTLLTQLGHTYEDFGPHSFDPSDDFPDLGLPVAQAVGSGQFDRGILLCGSGVGMGIVANKVKGVRAVVAYDPYTARTSREHDDTNVLSLGERVIGREMAKEIVRVWLATDFLGEERLRRRLKKIAELEK